jgi:hypothetical protein
MGRPLAEDANASDNMAQPPDTNLLELRVAFHNAVSRFQDFYDLKWIAPTPYACFKP